MARKRMLSPDIWRDKKTIQLNNNELILMIGAISAADDEGIIEPDAHSFFFELGRRELTTEAIQEGFDKLFKLGILVKYGDYAFFPNWFKHQYIERPQPSKHKKPPKSIIDNYPEYINQWLGTMTKHKDYKDLINYPYGREITLTCMKNHTVDICNDDRLKCYIEKNIADIESKRLLTDKEVINPASFEPTGMSDYLEYIAIEEQEIAHRLITDQSPNDHRLITPKRKEKNIKESKLIEPNRKEINKKEPKRTEPNRDDEEKKFSSKKPIGLITSMIKDFLDFNKLEINEILIPDLVDRILEKNLDRSFCEFCLEYSKTKNPSNLEGYFVKAVLEFDSLIKQWEKTKGLDFEIKEKIPIKSELDKNCPDCNSVMTHDKGEFQCKSCHAIFKMNSGKLEKITAEEIPKDAFKLDNFIKPKEAQEELEIF